jgi:hypothetical protein
LLAARDYETLFDQLRVAFDCVEELLSDLDDPLDVLAKTPAVRHRKIGGHLFHESISGLRQCFIVHVESFLLG